MLKFNSDGKFKIMQISDAQDLPLVRKSLVRMINRACDVLQPDLVLFTGDNILGNHINDAVIGTKQIASGHDATKSIGCCAETKRYKKTSAFSPLLCFSTCRFRRPLG